MTRRARLGHGPASVSPHGGGPVTHRGAPAAGSSVGSRRQPPLLPGPVRRSLAGLAGLAAARKSPQRAEPAASSLGSSTRPPPCELCRPLRRVPGPPCRSGEDAAGGAPHLAGRLGLGKGVLSLCRVKEVIFLAEKLFFFPAPFRQCLASTWLRPIPCKQSPNTWEKIAPWHILGRDF